VKTTQARININPRHNQSEKSVYKSIYLILMIKIRPIL